MMMSKSAWRKGTLPTFHFSARAGSVTSSKSTTRDFLTAKTVSDSMYSLPATKMCVVSGRWPGAATMKWMCAGRNACRPVALSSSPTGPSVGIG